MPVMMPRSASLRLGQFSRPLGNGVELRILACNPLYGLGGRVLPHKKRNLLNPRLRYQRQNLCGSLFVTDYCGRKPYFDLLLLCLGKVLKA